MKAGLHHIARPTSKAEIRIGKGSRDEEPISQISPPTVLEGRSPRRKSQLG